MQCIPRLIIGSSATCLNCIYIPYSVWGSEVHPLGSTNEYLFEVFLSLIIVSSHYNPLLLLCFLLEGKMYFSNLLFALVATSAMVMAAPTKENAAVADENLNTQSCPNSWGACGVCRSSYSNSSHTLTVILP